MITDARQGVLRASGTSSRQTGRGGTAVPVTAGTYATASGRCDSQRSSAPAIARRANQHSLSGFAGTLPRMVAVAQTPGVVGNDNDDARRPESRYNHAVPGGVAPAVDWPVGHFHNDEAPARLCATATMDRSSQPVAAAFGRLQERHGRGSERAPSDAWTSFVPRVRPCARTGARHRPGAEARSAQSPAP